MFVRHANASLTLRCRGALVVVSRPFVTNAINHLHVPMKPVARDSTTMAIRRHFQSSSETSAEGNLGIAAVKFSAGADETALNAALQELLRSADKGGRWSLIPNGQGLERKFKFKNFTKTWDFMTAVSLQCKLKNHHPEWSNVYNTTYIRWTTHSPAGLSAKDTELARLCDSLARDFGEEIPDDDDDDDGNSCALRQAADRVVADAGTDCCTPKKR
ncbi:transcriptional coactivator/pterin dehydratase [Xylaria sp. CBS 124048]|nr:transcriptional coactivator/pterin dehydratase [Xylaria sp. CBS 124048]